MLFAALVLSELTGCSGSRCSGILARCGGSDTSEDPSANQPEEPGACEQASLVAEHAAELCGGEDERYDTATESHNILALEVYVWEATIHSEGASFPEAASACIDSTAGCEDLVTCLESTGLTLPATFPESPAAGTTVATKGCGEVVF